MSDKPNTYLNTYSVTLNGISVDIKAHKIKLMQETGQTILLRDSMSVAILPKEAMLVQVDGFIELESKMNTDDDD